jgi:hypothetical protein
LRHYRCRAWPFQASTDHRDSPDMMEPALAIEPTDTRQPNDPADPIDRIDPADPMDKMDPVDPIDKIEPDDPIDRIDPALPLFPMGAL